jgi:hypothetical protein
VVAALVLVLSYRALGLGRVSLCTAVERCEGESLWFALVCARSIFSFSLFSWLLAMAAVSWRAERLRVCGGLEKVFSEGALVGGGGGLRSASLWVGLRLVLIVVPCVL